MPHPFIINWSLTTEEPRDLDCRVCQSLKFADHSFLVSKYIPLSFLFPKHRQLNPEGWWSFLPQVRLQMLWCSFIRSWSITDFSPLVMSAAVDVQCLDPLIHWLMLPNGNNWLPNGNQLVHLNGNILIQSFIFHSLAENAFRKRTFLSSMICSQGLKSLTITLSGFLTAPLDNLFLPTRDCKEISVNWGGQLGVRQRTKLSVASSALEGKKSWVNM